MSVPSLSPPTTQKDCNFIWSLPLPKPPSQVISLVFFSLEVKRKREEGKNKGIWLWRRKVPGGMRIVDAKTKKC